MSHHSVKTLLLDVAKNLADNMQVGYGRRSEFNMIANKRYPYIWLLPLSASGMTRTNPTRTKTWNVAIVFLNQDNADANEKQSELILDQMDEFVDRYVRDLDEWYQRSSDIIGAITLQNDSQQPFYKDEADIHTGWLLTFQMVVSDDFEYCTPENIDLYAGNI
jgi:hypothetical protein